MCRGSDVQIWLVIEASAKRLQHKDPAKRSQLPTQHIATLLRASCCVRSATVLRHVATCWVLLAQIWPFTNFSQQHPNMSQHIATRWPNARNMLHLKPRLNDRNVPTQHIATLLGATCCVLLATVLRCVATCWVLLAEVWKCSNLSQQHPTRRNMLQQGGQTHATCCAQQCCDMLRWHVKSPGQTIATCQRNTSQHCWAEHVVCVWPPCCDVLRHAGCCWLSFDHFTIVWPRLDTL